MEAWALAYVEALVGYHPRCMTILTQNRNPVRRQCQAGSLTGAVASQKVTEALKGSLRMVGNHSARVKAEGSLTARLTSRAGTKVGRSEPWVPHARSHAT